MRAKFDDYAMLEKKALRGNCGTGLMYRIEKENSQHVMKYFSSVTTQELQSRYVFQLAEVSVNELLLSYVSENDIQQGNVIHELSRL